MRFILKLHKIEHNAELPKFNIFLRVFRGLRGDYLK